MTRTLLLGLLLGYPGSAFAMETPCFRELGGIHEAALLNASPSELSAQARCLILEYSVFPKARFIPPAAQLHPTAPYHITVLQSDDGKRVTASSLGPPSHRVTLLEQSEKPSLGLGDPGSVFNPKY
jgi:hypothetical protein